MDERKRIKTESGTTEHECACPKCENLCKRAPCLGTPADILRLINNGYTNALVLTEWLAGYMYNMPPLTMFQLRMTHNGCIMFENGKCKLHALGLKPTEGVLSNGHSPYSKPGCFPLTAVVAQTWNDHAQIPTINKIITALNKTGDNEEQNRKTNRHYQRNRLRVLVYSRMRKQKRTRIPAAFTRRCSLH